MPANRSASTALGPNMSRDRSAKGGPPGPRSASGHHAPRRPGIPRPGPINSTSGSTTPAMSRHRYLHLALCGALLAASTPSTAQRDSDPLAPIVKCVRSGKFNVLEQGRLPATVTSRSVETLSGAKSVTMLDGYRVILATSQGKPFVNLKVELSVPASAAADREAVREQMQAFSSRRSPDQKELQRALGPGVEVLALHQPTLARSGPISFYSMFVPKRSIIATLYVLNQAPEGRAFSTYGEYETLRDEAVNLVQACLAAGGT